MECIPPIGGECLKSDGKKGTVRPEAEAWPTGHPTLRVVDSFAQADDAKGGAFRERARDYTVLSGFAHPGKPGAAKSCV